MYAPDPIILTVEGPAPRKNDRHRVSVRNGKAHVRNSKRFTGWTSELWAAWLTSLDRKVPDRLVKTGRWMLRLRVYEKAMRHLKDGTDVPHGDDGSASECVKDALQKVGILDDDARIVCTITTKHYDKQRPRVELELRPWDDRAPTKWASGSTLEVLP